MCEDDVVEKLISHNFADFADEFTELWRSRLGMLTLLAARFILASKWWGNGLRTKLNKFV
jgi:hypothetical protein